VASSHDSAKKTLLVLHSTHAFFNGDKLLVQVGGEEQLKELRVALSPIPKLQIKKQEDGCEDPLLKNLHNV